MTIVAGYAPDERGRAGLELAATLARSAGEDLVVCVVVPAPWVPGMARIDAEYQAFLDDRAHRALDHARADLPSDVAAAYAVHSARSAPSGLLEVAEQHDATAIVLGSSTSGVFGHIALGSVTGRLLHSSPYPVALATRGFRSGPDGKVTRVTVAYGGSEQADDLVVAAAVVASRMAASLRLASFAVTPRPPYTAGVGRLADDARIGEWAASMQAAAQKALQQAKDLHPVPQPLEVVVGYGEDWDEALDDIEWRDGDVLTVGSSAVGPAAQVFLGSRAGKIVRHSPVPVVVVPRAAAQELAGQ
jgi:nucleotide-binding universal stress UspA family protein